MQNLLPESDLIKVFERFKKQNPKPKGELQYSSPYTLLVAVVCSAQSTDKGVNAATAKLFKEANTPFKMVLLGEERIIELIRTIGLYRNKAKNIIGLSKILLDRYESKVPKNLESLEQLPGVGRKTANVVLNIAYGFPTIAVDTHVFRVSNRTRIAPGKNVKEVETILNERVPKKFLVYAHHWLILHGRYVCKARSPLCNKCLISDLCPSKL
ncbi:MAG: Endonuclease III [Alphaproteobacteria bacterium MarineAlpha9_Bin2]|nr:MAG: Endonuclease III [Alphaproteobacteria bacterium MarineAlpha9_Bin2]